MEKDVPDDRITVFVSYRPARLCEFRRPDPIFQRTVCFDICGQVIDRLDHRTVTGVVPVLVVLPAYCFRVRPDNDAVDIGNAREFILGEGFHLVMPVGRDQVEYLLVHLLFLIGLDEGVEPLDGPFDGRYDIACQDLGEIMEQPGEIIVKAASGTCFDLQREKIREDGNDEHVSQHRRAGYHVYVAPAVLETQLSAQVEEVPVFLEQGELLDTGKIVVTLLALLEKAPDLGDLVPGRIGPFDDVELPARRIKCEALMILLLTVLSVLAK